MRLGSIDYNLFRIRKLEYQEIASINYNNKYKKKVQAIKFIGKLYDESKYKSKRPVEQSNPNDCNFGSEKDGGKLGRIEGDADGLLVRFN